jgi:predicted transcriptional regulator
MSKQATRSIVSAQVSQPVREKLERLADEADRTLSAEVRRALTAHIMRSASVSEDSYLPPEPA